MPKYKLLTEPARKFMSRNKCCICGKRAHGMISKHFYCNQCYELKKQN